MEFKEKSRLNQRHRLIVPSRGGSPSQPVGSSPSLTPKPVGQTTDKPINIAEERVRLGFDDIPTDESEASFFRVFGTWVKQSTNRKDTSKKLRGIKISPTAKLKSWKNDLKWAIEADLDEPVVPKPKSPTPAIRPTIKDTDAKTIDININFGSLPKIPRPNFKKIWTRVTPCIKYLRYKKFWLIVGVALVILVVIYTLPATWHTTGVNTPSSVPSVSGVPQKAQYKTILPSGKTIKNSAWLKTPDGSAQFAYADTIDSIGIKVGEQQLPVTFKSNLASSVATLAKSYSATDKVDAGGTTVYIGTSGEGPQSVIFVKNNLLMLIKSDSKISDSSWQKYVQSLN